MTKLRSMLNNVIIYQPYQSPASNGPDTTLSFLKMPNPHFTRTCLPSLYDEREDGSREPMRALNDVAGYSAVFLPGEAPTFIIKSASCPPQLINTREKPVQSLTSLHTKKCEKGVAYIDHQGSIKFAQLPAECQYHTGWVTRKIAFGEDIHALDHHEPTATHIIGVSRMVDFKLPEDETHPEWATETTSFLPQVEQGTVKLLDHGTWSIIDE
ncbi:MAG: hypothetical protein Q9210_002531 [Variospora velana]